jgi:DNA-binding beta-propeller fold protein YncE
MHPSQDRIRIVLPILAIVLLASNVVAANGVTGRIYAASTGNELSVVDGRLSSLTYNTVLSSVGSFSGSNDVAVNPNTNLIYLMSGSLLKIFDDSISSPSNAIAALINWVTSLSLAQGATNSLTSKLSNALSALESPTAATQHCGATSLTHSLTKPKPSSRNNN